MEILLSASLAMVAGLFMSRVVKPLKVPAVTGYLIAGVLMGPYCLGRLGVPGLGFTSMEAVHGFSVVADAALGFIAFAIGNEFRVEQLKKIGKSAAVIALVQALLATALVDGALLVLCKGFGIISPAAALTLGAIATATAPAATLMVIKQYKARGKVTDILLPVVALDDAVGLVVFAVSFGVARSLSSGTVDLVSVLVNPLVEVIGSLALGSFLGWGFSVWERSFQSNTRRLNLAVTFVLQAVAFSMIKFHIGPVHVGFSSLLVCMAMGTVFCNICDFSEDLMTRADKWSQPLMVLFFVLSGAELELSVFANGAIVLIGLVYIAARSLGKIFGASLSARWMKCDPVIVKYLGITLLPQAGVALGMSATAASTLGADGTLVRNIALFSVLIYELVGPSLTRIALVKSGDIISREAQLARDAAEARARAEAELSRDAAWYLKAEAEEKALHELEDLGAQPR